jgi:hypothetical protein
MRTEKENLMTRRLPLIAAVAILVAVVGPAGAQNLKPILMRMEE